MSQHLALPTPELTRRRLLQGTGATAAAAFVGTLTALHARNAQAAVGGKQTTSAVTPYGPIAPVNDLATGCRCCSCRRALPTRRMAGRATR